MGIVSGVNGGLAALLLCTLLFVDEAGVPVPIAPNEVLLVLAGVLIAGGTLPVWAFVPAAALSMTVGMLTGYTWARRVGPAGLRRVAGRLGAARHYDRAQERIRRAGPGGVAVSRLLPGVRAYATLVAGAAEVELRTFLTGAVPALLAWMALFTALGFFAGLPIALFLDRVTRLVVHGGLLLVLGAGSWAAARHLTPAGERGPLQLVQTRWRIALAAAVDLGIVATVAAGLDGVARWLVHRRLPGGRLDALLLLAFMLLGYLAASRRGSGATVGERMLSASYRCLPSLRASVGRLTGRGRLRAGRRPGERNLVGRPAASASERAADAARRRGR